MARASVVRLIAACVAGGPLLLSSPAFADQCSELRAHIAQLDQLIAKDTIQSSRNLRIQDRNNWVNAYNAICTRRQSGSGGGGGFSGGGFSGGGGRAGAALGAAAGILGLLGDMARQAEAQRLEAEQEARRQQLLWENQQRLEEARRQAEELERRRQAAAARAVDDKRRRAMLNPWAPAGPSGGGANPFGSTVSGRTDAANPFDGPAASPRESANPFDAPPPRNQVAGAGVPAGVFKTDEQIKAFCARSSNSSMCELAEQDLRARNPAYQQWKRERAARLERDHQAAQRRIDEAIAEYKRKTASTQGGGAAGLPPYTPAGGRPLQPGPTVVTGPGAGGIPLMGTQPQAKTEPFGCGPGSVPPDVVSCYPQAGGGRPPAKPDAAPEKTKIKDLLRQRLKDVLATRNRNQLRAQVAALEEAVVSMPPGPERDRMQTLLARLKGALGGGAGGVPPVVPMGNQTELVPTEKEESAAAPGAPQSPPGEPSPEVAQALRDRPTPGTYRNLTAEQCRKWQGRWSEMLGDCQIAPLGQTPGGTDRLLIVDEPGSIMDPPDNRTVQEAVAEMQKLLFATPEDPTGYWMGRPVPPGAQPEKTLFDQNREAIRRAEREGRVGGAK